MDTIKLDTKPLEARRRELAISKPTLAKRSGVSLATIHRILLGDVHDVTLSRLGAVADALGMEIRYLEGACRFSPARSVFDMQRDQAQEKAERLVRLTQGTSALEGQAVSDATIREAIEQTVATLLTGPKRRLWA